MARDREAQELLPLVERVHARLRPDRPLRPEPRISFYPYAGARSVVREREGRMHLRLSDQLAGAPDVVIEGVTGILLARFYGLPDSRADAAAVRAYRAYVTERHQPPTSESLDTRWVHAGAIGAAGAEGWRGLPAAAPKLPPPRRGRKHIDPVGTHRSLLESFLRVSLDMDLQLPQVPRLSWSKTVSGHRFGHWDPDHNVIVVSQILDDPEVPEFVLDYVVYHEILHILHPVRMGSGTKRIVHGAAFRRDERRFPRWAEGEEWIARLARRARRERRGWR